MAGYGDIKGRTPPFKSDDTVLRVAQGKPSTEELSDAERAHSEAMKLKWEEYFPNDPMLKEMYRLGMIVGYRNVVSIEEVSVDQD